MDRRGTRLEFSGQVFNAAPGTGQRSEGNLYVWASRYDEFKDILRKARDVADDRVELSLYQRACGYEFRGEKVFRNPDGSVLRVETTEHIPADVGAATLWLKNRRRDTWRRRNDNFSDPVTINLTMKDLAGAGVIIDGEANE